MTNDTRQRMLETTARLLQHRGYHGTSLSTILQESGAPRGSLYFHFPGGKDQIVVEATRMAVEETTREFRHAMAEARTPGQGVRAFLDSAALALEQTEYTFGCPVAPVILDATGGIDELAELCREAFEEWVELMQEAFVESGIEARRARALALLVESSLEGLLLIGRAYHDTSAFRSVGAELEAIVDGAVREREAPAAP